MRRVPGQKRWRPDPLSLFFLFLSFSFSLFSPSNLPLPLLPPPLPSHSDKGVKKIPSGPIGAVLRLIRLSFRAHSAPLSNGGPSLSVCKVFRSICICLCGLVLQQGGGEATQKQSRENILLMAFSLLYAVFFASFHTNSSPQHESSDRKKSRKCCERRREAAGLKSDPIFTKTPGSVNV